MKQEVFSLWLSKLGTMYDKKITDEMKQAYWQELWNQEDDLFIWACKKIVQESPYFPKVADIFNKMNEAKIERKKAILMFMKDKGYFKSVREYDKAIMWASSKLDQIPQWLKDDMHRYYQMMLGKDIKK